MKNTLVITLLATAVLSSGCASILNEKTQKINIATTNGETVKGTIDGVPFSAPGIATVTRENKDKVIVTETPNCAKETALSKSVDSKFFINILSGGVFGSSTDYGTEKMWKYEDSVTISCKK